MLDKQGRHIQTMRFDRAHARVLFAALAHFDTATLLSTKRAWVASMSSVFNASPQK